MLKRDTALEQLVKNEDDFIHFYFRNRCSLNFFHLVLRVASSGSEITAVARDEISLAFHVVEWIA